MDFFYTDISKKAINNAVRVLRSGWVSEGKLVKEFEDRLSELIGIINPVVVNSGTSALHLALVVAGVKEGDEVIIPAQTFVATGLSILMQKAIPVFADIRLDTANIDPDSIRKKITKKTKAIIPVHWAGYPCDLDEINKIAKEHKLIVIEDAAHALGATYKDRPIGSISRFTAFSFQAIKHLTTGDGGALSCKNINDYKKAKISRWFGIDRQNSKPSILGERKYDIAQIGFKYHLNDLGASVGLGNLSNFCRNLKRRRQIASRFQIELSNMDGIKLLNYKNDRNSAYWIFTMLVDKRESFILSLRKKGIPASVVHLRIDRNSIFGGVRRDLVNQSKFDEMQVSIPVHQGLSDKNVDLIIKTIRKGW